MQPSSGSTASRLPDLIYMTWDSVKSFFSAVWAWCVRYWQFLAGLCVAAVAFLLFRRRQKDPDPELVDSTIESHKREVAAIDESHRIETSAIDAARARRDAQVDRIVKEHEAQMSELDNTKRERIEQIVAEHGDNPEEITRRISALTGIRITGGGQ